MHRKAIRVTLISISFCLLVCVGIRILSEIFEESTSQAAVRRLTVRINSNQRQELFDQLRRFAEKHAFEYSVTDYGGQGKYFLVDISGDNVQISTVETSSDLDTFSIRFYTPSPGDPGRAILR